MSYTKFSPIALPRPLLQAVFTTSLFVALSGCAGVAKVPFSSRQPSVTIYHPNLQAGSVTGWQVSRFGSTSSPTYQSSLIIGRKAAGGTQPVLRVTVAPTVGTVQGVKTASAESVAFRQIARGSRVMNLASTEALVRSIPNASQHASLKTATLIEIPLSSADMTLGKSFGMRVTVEGSRGAVDVEVSPTVFEGYRWALESTGS